MSSSPTPQFKGEVGAARYFLSLPQIRPAQLIEKETDYDPVDGRVRGFPGDVAITAYGGETWPVKRDIFLGTYRLIGSVSRHLIAQRLTHVRVAWPVTSVTGEFDYRPRRGVVGTKKGGYVYQSDESDFGYLSPEVKDQGHIDVGLKADIDGADWPGHHRRALATVTLVPPVLALLALLAFAVTSHDGPEWVANLLIWSETVLLAFGVGLVIFSWRYKWPLKAAVVAHGELCRQFQVAVELLGEAPSDQFPAMAMMRASQQGRLPLETRDDVVPIAPGTKKDDELKAAIATTLESLKEDVHRSHGQELLANVGSIVALGVIFLANAFLLVIRHSAPPELVAIWLPSVVGAAHAFTSRRSITDRIQALEGFASQLGFVQKRLFQDSTSPVLIDRLDNLRLLCRFVADHSEREAHFALGDPPPLPV